MKQNKIIAPAIITFIMVIYYVGIAFVCMLVPAIPFPIKLLLVVVPLALAGVVFAMFWERVKEIRSGEEDDLSKY